VIGFVDRGVLAVRLPFDQDGQCLGIAHAAHVRKSLLRKKADEESYKSERG
jgi:hypothetical protein